MTLFNCVNFSTLFCIWNGGVFASEALLHEMASLCAYMRAVLWNALFLLNRAWREGRERKRVWDCLTGGS